jgi:hypothetical protein
VPLCGLAAFLPDKTNYFLKRPDMIGNARFHRRRNAQRLVNADEIVMHEMERNRRFIVPRTHALRWAVANFGAHAALQLSIILFNIV